VNPKYNLAPNDETLSKFRQDGYVIGHLFDDSQVEEAKYDLNGIVHTGEFRTNSGIYSYNASPRIVEAWRSSKAIHRMAYDKGVITLLEYLYKAKPRAFSTINFLRSTEQPLHSDYMHFGTQPHFQLAAVWIALEDIDLAAGPLQVVPGSHLSELFCYSDLGFAPARTLGEIKVMYTAYEKHVAEQIALGRRESVPVIPLLRQGDFLIWDANLLHGSPRCIDSKLSRLSQVTHYHFDNTKLFYNPAFSQPKTGRYVSRKVDFIPEITYD